MVGGFGLVEPVSFFASEEYGAEQEASTKMQDISAELNNLPPLNLTLRKTPSFLNLIKTKLSTRATGPSASQQSTDKLKASNFPISFIRIGSWQEVSKNEADLVAKCYFSKKKLVWEVLRNGLKSKIEIQWSDIAAIRATVREDDQPGILELELDQVPAFYQESNPQPRKHTIWHLTTDFTQGQASMHRRHYVTFPPGTLDKHLEKLLQCDRRLLELTNKGFPFFDSPYFNWTPYEYNTCYYSFSGGGDPSMEVKPQVQLPAAPPPQWAIQPPLLGEEYSTTSPVSAGSRDTTTVDFTHNDHGTNYGFGDTRVDYWDQGSNPSFYGEASSQQHRDGYPSLQCHNDNIGFGLLAEQSSQHSPMGFSSGVDYSMLSYQSGYVDNIITSCASGLVDANEGCTGANRFIYPPFMDEFGVEDSSRMNMNWY